MTIELLVAMLGIEAIRQGMDVSKLGIGLGWDGRWHALASFPIILASCMDDIEGGRRLSSIGHISGVGCWALSGVKKGIKRVVLPKYEDGNWFFDLYV